MRRYSSRSCDDNVGNVIVQILTTTIMLMLIIKDVDADDETMTMTMSITPGGKNSDSRGIKSFIETKC